MAASPVSAAARFDALIAPLGRDDFLARYWGREYTLQRGEASRFASLFSWSDLNAVLESRAFGIERLRFYQGGRQVDEARYAVSTSLGPRILAGAVETLFAGGATLILDSVHVHSKALTALASSCEEALHAETVINVYASRGDQPGFKLHWDWQEAIVLQLDGRKHWQVFAPTLAHPLRSHGRSVALPQGDPVWQGTMEPGDFLYLPRGWWHLATPLDEPSLHLTVTAVPPTGADFLDWVGQRMRERLEVRANVPAAGSSAHARAGFVDALRQAVLASVDGAALDEFLAQWDATLQAGEHFQLPGARAGAPATPGARVRLAAGGKLGLVGAAGAMSFFANGVRWDCPSGLEGALQRLDGEAAIALEALMPGADAVTQSRLRAFLVALHLAGVVVLED